MWNRIGELLYPETCIVCHRISGKKKEEKMCSECRKQNSQIEEPRCKRCSKPVTELERELCEDCGGHTFYVESGFALYPYNDWMKKAVRNIKYQGEQAGLLYFGNQMAERYESWLRKISPDVILPVPVHWKKLRFRGFNQAAGLARVIGEKLDIPVREDTLIRTENTSPQKGLGRTERMKNLQRGFSVCEEKNVRFRDILLVDDIYTTGATLEACGRVLKQAGSGRIYFLCLCIGGGD